MHVIWGCYHNGVNAVVTLCYPLGLLLKRRMRSSGSMNVVRERLQDLRASQPLQNSGVELTTPAAFSSLCICSNSLILIDASSPCMCIYLWNTDWAATVGGETVSRTESHVAISLGGFSVLCYFTDGVYRPLLNRHYRNRRYTFVVQAHRSTSCWRQVARLLPSLIRPTCLYSRLDSSCEIYQIATPRLSRVQTYGSRDPWEGDHG